MLTSVHLFVGAALGKATGNVYVTIPVAMVSHYLLDMIPHYNPKPVKSYKEKGLCEANKKDLLMKSLEPLIGIALLGYFISLNETLGLVMITGAFFGWLPDLFIFLEWKFNIICRPRLIKNFETVCHYHITFIIGTIPQVIISLLAVLYII